LRIIATTKFWFVYSQLVFFPCYYYINTVVKNDNRRTPKTPVSWAAPLSLSLAQVEALVRVRVTVSLADELVPVADSVRA